MKRTAKFYSQNKASRDKKQAYDKKYNATPSATAKRVELNRHNRRSEAAGRTSKGDKKDLSHTKNGLVYKHQSTNRGSKSDSSGDKRARGSKK